MLDTEPLMAREIAITRVFDAPREQVWRAWTDPDQLVRWWGKRGWTAQRSSLELNLRPGGRFRIVSVADADGSEMINEGVWREVVEPERLVFAAAGASASDPDLTVVTFTDLGDGRTEMRFQATVHLVDELRDRALAGLQSAFDRLAEQIGEKR